MMSMTVKPPIYIVDEDDTIVGQKPRNDRDASRDIYRVSAVWVVNSFGQALMAKRKQTKPKDPGLWQPSVAGTVEVGETYEESAYKEAKEEVGMADYELIPLEKIRVRSQENFFCQYFGAIIDKPLDFFTLQEDEVEQLVWVDIEALRRDFAAHPSKYVSNMNQGLEVLLNWQNAGTTEATQGEA